SPYRPTPAKQDPYESGMIPLGTTRDRFSVKFYMVAILFIIFDIEVVFLVPWSVLFRQLGLFGFVEMLVFMAALLVGYVYVWKKGALQWDRPARWICQCSPRSRVNRVDRNSSRRCWTSW